MDPSELDWLVRHSVYSIERLKFIVLTISTWKGTTFWTPTRLPE
jgi:hypothetical protein